MLRNALVVSVALHALFGVWVEVRGSAQPPAWREVADSWTGPGIEVDAIAAPNAGEMPSLTAREATATNADVPADATEATHDALVMHGPDKAHESTATSRAADTTHAATPTDRASDTTHPATATDRASDTTHPATPTKPALKRATSVEKATQRTAAAASATPAESSAAAPSELSASGNGAASGAFGAQGLPLGVRHLPKAFTRALSIADRSDPRWLTLPPGPAGEARVEIPVDEDGKLGELLYRDDAERARLSPVVRHLLENTRLLLESGKFSVDPAALRAGVQRLRVRVEVLERERASDPDADPNELKELEYEPPTATKPGRGSFALNSGRRVIGWVYVE